MNEMKVEQQVFAAFHDDTSDSAIAARIAKLEDRIVKQKADVVDAEAQISHYATEIGDFVETLGYDVNIQLEEAKAMLRNSQRELNKLLGNPPSAEEVEEDALKKTFTSLSFKAGMYAYVREDIIESSPYILDLKTYWNRHITACKEAIEDKQPLGDYCHE